MSQLLAMPVRPARSKQPIIAAAPLPEGIFADLRRRLVLDCCKWDPQVGDVSTLASFPLILSRHTWSQLARWAEALSMEATAAEKELVGCPNLLRRLGLPRRVREVLADRSGGELTPAAGRVIRFDFHWTTDGWQISEANSDVPGGFTEASSWTQMVAPHYRGCEPGGNPAARLAEALAESASDGGAVALLAAPGYMEDQQVVAYLADYLCLAGLHPHVCDPRQLRWHVGRAWMETAWHCGPVSAVVRFYQGEWLARLPRRNGWRHLLRGGRTPVCNPLLGLLTESKRFPLGWDHLRTALPTWRTLLPETRDPRDAPWRRSDDWLLKAAFCNTGDEVAIRSAISFRSWRQAVRSARWNPGRWMAQRRFEIAPISTPIGTVFPCIGVYTVNGRAAGIYGRISFGPVVDYRATDVAVLVRQAEVSDDP